MNKKIAHVPLPNSSVIRNLKIAAWKAEPMDILIRTEGIDLTAKLREAISLKIGRVRRYAPSALRARVQLHKFGANTSNKFRARVHYEIPGNDVVAEHTTYDALAALDLVTDKLERRLRRRKTAQLARRVRVHRTTPDRWQLLATASARNEMETRHG